MDSQFGSHWKPVFLPVRTPLRTRPGENLRAELTLHDGSNVEWSLRDRRHTTLFEGYLNGR